MNRKIDEENTDDFNKGWNNGEFVGRTSLKACIEDYRIWSRHREYKSKKICKSAEKSGFVALDAGTISLTEDGERLVEGYIWGFLRELISREWKLISLLFIAIGWVIGRYTK
ncbi:MAG TPA: hypothetical protein VGE30_01415 [Candidatus Saccharimonadales bacterium]